MGVVSFFLVRSARRSAALAAAASAAAAAAPQASALTALDAAPVSAAAPEPVDAAPPPPPIWRVASLANDPTVQLAQGEVGKRTMVAALGAAGLGKAEVLRVVKAFDTVKSLDHTAPKDTYAFAKDKESGKVVAFEYAVSPLDVWQARDNAGTLEANKLALPTETRRVAVGVAVGDDLRDSIVKAGLDDDLLKMLDDALEGHAELADLRPGARLRIVAMEDRVEGAFAGYASLDAVEYTPANPSAPKLRVYWFSKAPASHAEAQKSGLRARAGGYYDGKGQQPYHGGWRSPVPFARIASRFNPHRMHPVLHVVMPHNGVDFAAPPGTPVYASAAGVVKSVGDGGPCGNMVQIQHPSGLTSAYCHLSRFAAGLHVGQHVEQRQLVGNVGQTGRATGPHLHFAIKRGEVFLDPLAFKLDGVRVLPSSLRDEFAKTRVEMDLALEAIPLPAPVAGTAGDGGGGTTDETVFDDSPGLE
jgi:murein DD-endopeptidase MepM/ murein hydrolase activator NlpD